MELGGMMARKARKARKGANVLIGREDITRRSAREMTRGKVGARMEAQPLAPLSARFPRNFSRGLSH
jgi:hypothetical protein